LRLDCYQVSLALAFTDLRLLYSSIGRDMMRFTSSQSKRHQSIRGALCMVIVMDM
jgi:hypothetical protein